MFCRRKAPHPCRSHQIPLLRTSSFPHFKRLRVAKLANRFPQAIQHLREGKTCLTHLALIGDKMTEANERVIWDNILDKGRREVEDFLRRVQLDGTVKQQADEMITLQITVTAEQEALIHQLTEVLSARGHVPTTAEAIMTAVDKLLDQRDQLRRATKMAAKDGKREVARDSEVLDDWVMMDETTAEAPTASRQLDKSHTAISSEAVAQTTLAQEPSKKEQSLLPQGSQSQEHAAAGRRRIPEAIKRAVFRRAEGRCQHLMVDGSRCGATRMVEIDHIIPLSRSVDPHP